MGGKILPLFSLFGKDEIQNIPYGAIAMYAFADKLACGLQQFMAGARKFRLSELSRDDMISANRETDEITRIPFTTDAKKVESLNILKG